MEKNILSGGIEELGVIKKKLIELNNYTEEKNKYELLEKQLEKDIDKEENKIIDEINKVTRQRRSEVEARIDVQIYTVEEKLKKIMSQKDKSKKKAMVERIDVETNDYRSEEEELSLSGKYIFKKEKIPFLYNNRLFFALYFPKGMGDIGLIILSIAITFFAIPLIFYYVLFNGLNVIYLALCNLGGIVIFGGLYLILGKIKYKHIEALYRVRDMRQKIQDSKKQQRKIKRQIRNDIDESGYGLEEFNKEIKSLEQSISALLVQKEKALTDFDNITSQNIKEQIDLSYEQELDSLKSEYSKTYQKSKENLDLLNDVSITVSSLYEGYLGKEFLTIEKIEQLEELINSGKASTISEAINSMSQDI